MIALMLGITTGFFMTTFINWRYNVAKWIASKYLLALSIISALATLLLYFFK